MISSAHDFYLKHISPIRYVYFSIITAVLHVAVFFICHLFVEELIVCNITSYIFSVVFSFILNKKVVFKNTSGQYGGQLIKYILIKFLSFVIDTIVLLVLTKWLSVMTMLAKLIANCSTTVNNYWLNKKFVFAND